MDYGLRHDGTPKGRGFLGEIRNTDGSVMTEYSIGVEFDGVEVDIPTITPMLELSEIKQLQAMRDGDDIPQSIIRKAIQHARMRKDNGLPYFATEDDYPLIEDMRRIIGID